MNIKLKFATEYEIALVNGLRDRTNESFCELYKKYSNSLLAIIFSIIKDYDDAEDILQDTFILILQKINLYDADKSRLFTWMAKIARNKCFDHLKSSCRRQRENIVSLHLLLDSPSSSHCYSFHTDMIGIKQICDHTLIPSHIEVINLLYYHGYTQKEAAEALNLPLGTIKTRNRLALVNLKKIFADQSTH